MHVPGWGRRSVFWLVDATLLCRLFGVAFFFCLSAHYQHSKGHLSLPRSLPLPKQRNPETTLSGSARLLGTFCVFSVIPPILFWNDSGWCYPDLPPLEPCCSLLSSWDAPGSVLMGSLELTLLVLIFVSLLVWKWKKATFFIFWFSVGMTIDFCFICFHFLCYAFWSVWILDEE